MKGPKEDNKKIHMLNARDNIIMTLINKVNKDIDMFEINEAFASQAYAVSRDLGLDKEKVNIYGGGISIGLPIGATGTILAVKVLYELMRTGKKDAMISMCIGGGQGISMYFTKY